MPELELDRAKELVEGFVARLQYTQDRSRDRGGKQPLKRGQLGIAQFDVLGEPEPKKQRSQPWKQT
jgi:hypothetical protein